MPSFTAIIPNYNDSARIGRSLEALFNQTRPFDEILIIDDGSTDNSIAVIEQLINGKSNVRLVRHETNRGVIAALNTGIEACRSDFLLMCSANDTYDTHIIEWCQEALKHRPDAHLIAGNALLSYMPEGAGRIKLIERPLSFPEARYYSPEEVIRQQQRAPIHFNGGASMLKCETVRGFGRLEPRMQWHCDWLMYNLIAFTHGVIYVPRPFSTIFVEDTLSYSSNINIWEKEKPVIETMLRILPVSYPAQATAFKRSALLPAFHLKNTMMLFRKDLAWFLTPLLVWRIGVHRLFYWLKYVLPRPLMMRIRTFLGV